MGSRSEAVEAYVKNLRTGEHSAAEAAANHLAKDVVLVTGNNEIAGYDKVVEAITGVWPNTAVYVQGGWSAPKEDGDRMKVTAVFPPLGAAPASANYTFSFNGDGKINRIEQEIVPQPPASPTDTIPDVVRGIVNGALANGTPICVAYVDEGGAPVQSLRGSTQVYSDTQLSIWLRNAEGGLARSLEKNPNMSLLWRDQKTRSTLIFQGRGHIEPDEAVRRRVFELAPEVEQNHDPGMRKGAALIIDLDKIQGGTVRGGVRMSRGG